MKNWKRISALVLCLMMLLALGTAALAAENEYTITAPANGHTYEIYQIFTGDYFADDASLSNVKAGQNAVSGIDVKAALAALEEVNTKDAADAAKLAVIQQYVDLEGDPYKTVDSSEAVTVPGGYYLIKDVDDAFADKNDSYTLYLAAIVGNTVISPKTDIPSVEKKVKDANDSAADSATDWQDSADYDIGDTVPFQLTATMGDLSAYQTYYIQFTDSISAGLTYQDDAAVSVAGVDKTSDFTIACENNVLTVTCNDVKALGAVEDSKIVVTYSCVLNADAVIGAAGNPNTVYLTFSNNPNNTGDGTPETGKTPEDKVVVFTYKIEVNKVDEDGETPLKGAGFTLYKLDASKVVSEEDATEENPACDGYVAVGEEVKGEDMTTFTWTGIDDGDYKLVESTTPVGYNTMPDQSFTVSAEHDSDAADPKLTALSGDLETGSVIAFTATKNEDDTLTGDLTATVENEKGAVLPTTGGIGTTIFYIVGAVLVLCAVVLLITKKRMANH